MSGMNRYSEKERRKQRRKLRENKDRRKKRSSFFEYKGLVEYEERD